MFVYSGIIWEDHQYTDVNIANVSYWVPITKIYIQSDQRRRIIQLLVSKSENKPKNGPP